MADQRICVVENCCKPSRRRQMCNAHWKRWKRHGDPLAGRTSNGDPAKFIQEVVLQHDGDDCLIWPFSRSRQGSAQFNVAGRSRQVARVICEIVNGPAPSSIHDAAHSCGRGNDGCVTKAHLRWATRKENEADKSLHGTRLLGERVSGAKLTEQDVREIRGLEGKMTLKQIAKLYGVGFQQVSNIIRRKNWSWLE